MKYVADDKQQYEKWTENKQVKRKIYVQSEQLSHTSSDEVQNTDAYLTRNTIEDLNNEDEYLSFLVAADWRAGR